MDSGIGSPTSQPSDGGASRAGGRGYLWIRDGKIDATVGREWMEWETAPIPVVPPVEDSDGGEEDLDRGDVSGYNEENGCDPMGRED